MGHRYSALPSDFLNIQAAHGPGSFCEYKIWFLQSYLQVILLVPLLVEIPKIKPLGGTRF